MFSYNNLYHKNLLSVLQEDVSGVLKFKVIQIQECEVRNSDLALIAGPSIE